MNRLIKTDYLVTDGLLEILVNIILIFIFLKININKETKLIIAKKAMIMLLRSILIGFLVFSSLALFFPVLNTGFEKK